jgi:hypothetical protein
LSANPPAEIPRQYISANPVISRPSHIANVAGSMAAEPIERAVCRPPGGRSRAAPRRNLQSARWNRPEMNV